jgi:hypothetical protein
LVIQNPDGSVTREPEQRRLLKPKKQTYYAQLPAQLLDEQNSLIDRIIDFAFDTLGARRLEVRIREAE